MTEEDHNSEPGEAAQDSEHLRSAQAHLGAAVDEFRAFCDEELPRLAAQMRQGMNDALLRSVDDAERCFGDLFEQLREQLKNRRRS